MPKTNTKKAGEKKEILINGKQCVEIALFMYKNYKKAITDSQFTAPLFEVWLQILLSKDKLPTPPKKGGVKKTKI